MITEYAVEQRGEGGGDLREQLSQTCCGQRACVTSHAFRSLFWFRGASKVVYACKHKTVDNAEGALKCQRLKAVAIYYFQIPDYSKCLVWAFLELYAHIQCNN